MVLTDRTRSGTTALLGRSINSTRHQYRGTNGSKYNQTIKTNSKEIYTQAEQEAGTSKGGIRTTTNYQCMDETLRPITSGVSVGYVSEPDKTTHFRTIDKPETPASQQGTNTTSTKRGGTNGRCTGNNTNDTHRCSILTEEDFYREHSSSTCTQENNGGSHGCDQHTHSIDDTVVRYNGPSQGHSCSPTVRSENGPFQGHHVQTSSTASATNGPTKYIKLVHWNAQGAIAKTSAIKTAIVQDDIDIVMIQDTRYKRRLDELPNLRIHGYHTYHRTMEEGGHGMVTLIKHPIPSEEADQIHIGDGTETLSTRIWLNNKPLILHNIYRVDGELDITTPLTRDPRSIMVGDFNARDEMWCRDHNRAGRLLNEQLQDLDNFCLMNHPQVWTTTYKTAIDLSLLPVDMAPLTNWSIYPGLLSDHLAVLLEIQLQHIPERVSVPKRWLTQHAEWELYREHITTTTTNIEWTDVDTNEINITKAILEAAELAIPKSSGKTSATPYWKNNMGIRMAKHIYNTKLKAYRRHTSPTNLEQVQTTYKEYTQLCTHVRNQSWNQWITECNGNINSAEVWRRMKAAKGTAPRPPTHPRPQEEADSLCDAFAQRCSSTNLPEHTNNILTNMAPERVRAVTTATYEAVDTDQEFTLSELEEVLHRLKDTAPGDDTVCYSMIQNVPLATKHLFLRLINQSFSEGRLPTRWKMAKIIPIPKKDKTHRPISLLPALSKVMERLVLTRVKWSAQPINPYSLGFRSGVGTIDAIATLIHKAAPITTLRGGYKSRSTTIFLDLEKAFELVSKDVVLESAALLGIRGQLLVWLDDYLTNRTGTVQFQGRKSKTNHMTNGTPQGSSLSPTLFNMVINRLLQLDLGSKVQMIAYADDLAIHAGSIGEDKIYEQMTNALKKIETKAVQLGLKFSPDKCEALWYRSNNPDWNFKIAGERIPWRASVKYLGVIIDKRLNFRKQVDYVRQKTDKKMNLLKVLNSFSDVNARILKNIYTATIQSTLEYGAVTFGMMPPSNIDRLQVSQNQGMRLILGVPRGTSAKMMRHELQMLPIEHRAKLMRAKLYRKIRGNTQHPLHTTINRRQRNGWTTEIQECHRLVAIQLEDPTQLKIDNTAPWEQLPYDCRIDWTKEGTEVLKQRSLEYIRSQPDDNTYYTDGSSDGTQVAAAVVHKKEEIIIRQMTPRLYWMLK